MNARLSRRLRTLLRVEALLVFVAACLVYDHLTSSWRDSLPASAAGTHFPLPSELGSSPWSRRPRPAAQNKRSNGQYAADFQAQNL